MIGGTFINELPSSIFQEVVSCQKQEQCTQNTNQNQFQQKQGFGRQCYGEHLMTYFTEALSVLLLWLKKLQDCGFNKEMRILG